MMMNCLIVDNQRISSLEKLQALFRKDDVLNSNSSLFKELRDLFIDRDIEDFLRNVAGENELADRIGKIETNQPDSELMRQLIAAIIGKEDVPPVVFDPMSCLEVLETTVKGNKATFKLRVLKRVNEKPFTLIITQPWVFVEAMLKNSNQSKAQEVSSEGKSPLGKMSSSSFDKFRQDKDYTRISNILTEIGRMISFRILLADFPYSLKVLPESTRQLMECLMIKKIDLSQLKQNEIIGFEGNINPNHDVWFFVGSERVGRISAETIAYNNYCESRSKFSTDDVEQFKVLNENAQKGWSQFQNLLGDAYRYGHGVKKSYGDAVSWYLKSAQKGNASAQCSLGEMYLYGKGVDINYEEAVKWFKKSSDQDDAMGQCFLGFMYEKGKSVNVDFSKALDLYTKSAMQNNSLSQCIMGRLYEQGKGVVKNLDQAMEWYIKAAIQDDALGQIRLGILVENHLRIDKNTNQIVVLPEIRSKYASIGDLFRKVIYYGRNEIFEINNDYQWINLLRVLYSHAGENTDVWERYNFKTGELEKASELIPGAILGSALCLLYMGTLSDSQAEKVRLYEKAASKDGPFAAYASIIMGFRYENGYGVRKDQSLAEFYYGSAIAFFGEKMVNETIRDIKKQIEEYERFWDGWNM